MASESFEESQMSVIELIKKPLLTVPIQYVRVDRELEIDDNKALNNSSPKIPTIDFNNLIMEDSSDAELEKLHLACKDWGIFQLVNHGVCSSLLEKLRNEVEDFFNLPFDEKMKYKIKPGDIEGYGTVNRTNLDWGDRVFMIINPISRRKPHLFPDLPFSLRTTLESYLMELQKITMKLFCLMGKALEIEKREVMIKELFEDGVQSMRMTYYPPCPQPELVVGLTPHSDATGITILNQINGVDGLQIKKDGVWIPVNILQHAFVVNVGDVLEIMSNGVYKSIEHRAMANSASERISLGMFFNPKLEAEIGPLPSSTKTNSTLNTPSFKTIGMEKYISDFFARRVLVGKSFLDQMRIEK